MKKQMLRTDTGEYRVAYARQPWLAVFMPLTGDSLHMGALIPHDKLFGSLDRLVWLLAACGLVVLGAWSLHRTSMRLLAPRHESALMLAQQGIHTQSVISSTFMKRVGDSLEQVARAARGLLQDENAAFHAEIAQDLPQARLY